jgi:nucleoid DNA-binding protein
MTLSMQYVEFPSLLYRYFSLNGSVSIPGLGALSLKRIPAVNDFSRKQVLPPTQLFKFNANVNPASAEQSNYIARLSGMDKEQVDNELKLMGEALKNRLMAERKLEWMDVGSFSLSDEGEIGFVPKTVTTEFFAPVHYVHVLRPDAEHTIKVGEEEKTNTDMEVFFEDQRTSEGKNKWQKAAMVLVFMAVLLLAIRFMFGSFDLLDSRYNPLKFITPKATYRVI